MATKIVTKNSSTASAVPTASDLVQGELAVNVADKRLFTEDNGGSIVELGTNPSTLTVTGEITANGGIDVTGTATMDGLVVDTSSVGGFKVTNEATSGVHLTTYQGTTNSNVRTAYVDSQEFVVSTGAPTGTTVTERFRIDSSGNVGIGTSSPTSYNSKADDLVVATSGDTGLSIISGTSNEGAIAFGDGTGGGSPIMGRVRYDHSTNSMDFRVNNDQAMLIDSSGNLLVGKSDSDTLGTAGHELHNSGMVHHTRATGTVQYLNRTGNDGTIADFRKDGSTVGSIGTSSTANFNINSSQSGHVGLEFGSPNIMPMKDGALADNAVDLGISSQRFKDLYLSGNVNAERVFTVHDGDWGMEMKGVTSARLRLHTSAGGSGEVGSITVTTSSTSYNTSSDYRLKEDWQPVENATDRLKELKPCNFAWKADGSRVDGFLAHELQEVVPEAVTGEKDAMQTEEYEVTPAVYEDVVIPATEEVLDEEGNVITEAQEESTEQQLVSEAVMGEREVPDYQGIDQSKLVPLLVATIQELEARISQLEE